MFIARGGWKSIRSSFVVLLMAGWFLNAAAISVAHLLHADTDPVLVRVLLAMSFNLPFGLLFNEVLAAREARNGKVGLWQCRAALSLIQLVCSTLAVGWLIPGGSFDSPEPYLLALALTGGSWTSYRAVILVYREVSLGQASPRFIVFAGAAPGLLTILSYGAWFVLYRSGTSHAVMALYAICVVPAACHYLLLRCLRPKFPLPPQALPCRVDAGRFLLLAAAVVGLCLVGLLGRRAIVGPAGELAAVALVLLNSLVSVAASVAKADYFTGTIRPLSGRTTLLLLGALLALVLALHLAPQIQVRVWTALACVAGAQLVLVRLLVSARQTLFLRATRDGARGSPALLPDRARHAPSPTS